MRSRHDFEVATWLGQLKVATRNGHRDLAGLATGGLESRPTIFGLRQGCYVGETEAGRYLVLRSQLGEAGFEVTTSFLRSRHGRQWGRSRHGFWCRDLEIPLWAETRSRHEIDVATLGSLQEGRDLDLASRPGLGKAWVSLVSQPGVLRSRPRVGYLGVSRPAHAQQARDLRWTCARHASGQLAVRAAAPTTWALRAQCARDLGSGCAHCAPNPVL